MADHSALRTPHSAILRLWPWLAAITTGALLTLCFPPWNQGWLCWIALTPLLAALLVSPGGAGKKAVLGYVAGFVFFLTTFWWLGSLAALYANRFLLAIPLLLAAFLGLDLAFWGWFAGALLPRLDRTGRFASSLGNLALGAAGASAWVVQEWVRERLFGGFGWNPLGVALHLDLPMIQIAEFTGSPGLSWLVAFVNVMAVIIIRRIVGELGPTFLQRIRWEFSVTMALVAGVFAFGLRALLHPDLAPSVPLRVAAIQPNTPQSEKFDPAAEDHTLAELARLTALAALARPAPQLILWPESAISSGAFASAENQRFLLDQAQRGDFALLLGTIDFDPQLREEYNGALLLTGHGTGEQFYRKIHLVPFGEYLPLRPVFGGFLGQLVPGDFTPGRDFTLLTLPDPPLQLAALICFEDTLGDLTRRFVAKGAHILINVTNDGWFAQTPAAEQHLANATLRAVETRRPLIRCGNTGITCAVLPSGQLDRWVPAFQQGFAAREVRVPLAPPLTFYTRHGDWVSALSGVITLLAALRAWRRKAEP